MNKKKQQTKKQATEEERFAELEIDSCIAEEIQELIMRRRRGGRGW